jgi:protein-L-isoaspartate(D-aspartate) O-methyltransferase
MSPFRLGHGEFMLKPNLEGRILQALALQPTDHVLEVGTGSGYLTACLARLATTWSAWTSLPNSPKTPAASSRRMASAIVLHTAGDASQSWGKHRYHAIAVTGSVATVTDEWRQSLSLGGRLFVVAGKVPALQALLITRVGEREWVQESLFETDLAPLRNAAPAKKFVF